jgi:hypothetical protein
LANDTEYGLSGEFPFPSFVRNRDWRGHSIYIHREHLTRIASCIQDRKWNGVHQLCIQTW